MARPHGRGIKAVRKRRADGTTATYYYHRATGRALGTDEAKAVEIGRGLDETAAPPPASSFDGLSAAYLASARFRALSPAAQKLNRLYVDRLRDLFRDLDAADITRPVVMKLREQESGRPWYATHLLSKLRLVLQHGVDIGLLRVNTASRPGGLRAPRRHEVWPQDAIDAMLTAAATKPTVQLACGLLLFTAQRPADVLSMTRAQVEERDGRMWLTLRQHKTGEIVTVPVHRTLEAMIRSRLADKARPSLLLVPAPKGGAWAYRNFSRAWDQTRKKAGVDGLQRRDLRRTAMVRMAEAGATSAQIAAVSGHTIDQTSRILDTYIPRRGEVAAGAIDAWERGFRNSVVVLETGNRQPRK